MKSTEFRYFSEDFTECLFLRRSEWLARPWG